MLNQEQLKSMLHYNPDTGIFTWVVNRTGRIKAGDIAGSKNKSNGYINISIYGVLYKAHRLAYLYMTGEFPSVDVDHKYGIRDDNRWSEIRSASRSDNTQNLRTPPKHNTTGYIGTSFYKRYNKFCAHIRVNNKLISLGYFDTVEEAHSVYIQAKRNLHKFCTI